MGSRKDEEEEPVRLKRSQMRLNEVGYTPEN